MDPLNNFVAFPGRVIPVNRIDPVAKKILDTYIPFPNLLANGAFEAQIPHPKDTTKCFSSWITTSTKPTVYPAACFTPPVWIR